MCGPTHDSRGHVDERRCHQYENQGCDQRRLLGIQLRWQCHTRAWTAGSPIRSRWWRLPPVNHSQTHSSWESNRALHLLCRLPRNRTGPHERFRHNWTVSYERLRHNRTVPYERLRHDRFLSCLQASSRWFRSYPKAPASLRPPNPCSPTGQFHQS